VEPDASALKALQPPNEFRPTHRLLPNCRQHQAARCYLISLPKGQVTEAASALLSMGEPDPAESPFGGPAYRWCGSIGNVPALATLSPHIENAVYTGGNNFRYRGGRPQMDERWVLYVVLMPTSSCI
jgi:hypothetical protein